MRISTAAGVRSHPTTERHATPFSQRGPARFLGTSAGCLANTWLPRWSFNKLPLPFQQKASDIMKGIESTSRSGLAKHVLERELRERYQEIGKLILERCHPRGDSRQETCAGSGSRATV